MSLSQLQTVPFVGFWGEFEDLPEAIAGPYVPLQQKLGYLRDRFEAFADLLL